MLQHAHHFTINGGQFIYNNHENDVQMTQNSTITYEQIKLATPSAPTVFTGRDTLVTEATQIFSKDEPAHLAILGAGGIGKTALALHIIKTEVVKEKFKDKIYFVPCELCNDAPSLIQIMLQTLKLSVPEGKTGYEILEMVLGSSSNPILLILDNFETPWNLTNDQLGVLHLVEFIRDQKNVSIILTMRGADGPGNRNWIKLGGQSGLPTLELDKAREAFMMISNSEKEDIQLLDSLLKELDCMPLAILLAAQLKRKLQLDTFELLESWKECKTKMLRDGTQESRLTSIEFSIGLSLQMLSTQNAHSMRMLPILSFLPNGIPSWKKQLKKLIPQVETAEVNLAVMALLDTALVHQADESLKMLTPIREYVQMRFPAEAEHKDQMGEFYLGFLNDVELNNQTNIELHLMNIMRVLEVQLQSMTKKRYLEASYQLFEYTKFFPVSISLIEITLRQEWEKGMEEEATLRFKKEYMLQWMGDYQLAREEIAKIEHAWTSGPNFKHEQKEKILAQCWRKLGVIAQSEDDYSEAKKMLAKAKAAFESLGDQNGAAMCLRSLGGIAQLENEYSGAKRMLAEAKAAFEHIGSQREAVRCLWSLGEVARMEHDYPGAKRMLAEAKAVFESIGNQDGPALCLQSLGEIARMEGDYSEAKRMLAEAKAAFEYMGFQNGAVTCLWTLGDMARNEHDYSGAKRMYAELKATFESQGDRNSTTRCLLSLGEIAEQEGNYSEAKGMLAEAKAVFESLGDQDMVASCLQSLGDVAQMEHDYAGAKRMFAEAKATFEILGDQDGAAWCLKRLGNAAQMEGDYSEAKRMLAEAKAVYESIGNQDQSASCRRSLGKIAQMENDHSDAQNVQAHAEKKVSTSKKIFAKVKAALKR